MQRIVTGVKPWQPNFDITVEGSDITSAVRENLVSLTLIDNGGSKKESDQLTFAVADDEMALPPKGTKIAISLGFGEELVDKGAFVVDALASGGSSNSHRIIQITARAYSRTNARGHSTLQSQKTRSWSGLTLEDVLKTVSNEHQLTFSIHDTLAGIQIHHIDQLGESDMNLLTRLAESYGAVSKVTHDHWVISPREAVTTVSGSPLKNQLITRDMVERWSYRENASPPDTSTAGSGTIVIAYHDKTDGGKVKNLTIGSGEPVIRHLWPQPDLESARSICSGSTVSSKKKTTGMNLELMGTPELMSLTAQTLITTEGFGSKEDRQWHIAALTMKMTTQGFVFNLELE
ncbi:contractile injection system protein, VgrG/Pvc8 family [Enterobacter ludwigii]